MIHMPQNKFCMTQVLRHLSDSSSKVFMFESTFRQWSKPTRVPQTQKLKKKHKCVLKWYLGNFRCFLAHVFCPVVSTGPTYQKVYVCMYVCALHFQSFFQGFWLGDLLASGSDSDILLIQDIELGNAGAWLSHATLRMFSLAVQCHNKIFYLRCFKSDFDAVKSKFGLLIE